MSKVKIVVFECAFYPKGVYPLFWAEWLESNIDAPLRLVGEVEIVGNYNRRLGVQLERGGAYLTAREVLNRYVRSF